MNYYIFQYFPLSLFGDRLLYGVHTIYLALDSLDKAPKTYQRDHFSASLIMTYLMKL